MLKSSENFPEIKELKQLEEMKELKQLKQLKELKELLEQDQSHLDPHIISKILAFYQIVLAENQVQNLTRLTEPQDFYEGHVIDVLELLKSGWLQYPAMDLGTGVGVPGILAGMVEPGEWILAESEKRKAEYLEKAVSSLGLSSQIRVFSGRGEEYLKNSQVQTIVARAVGPVERIYSWIKKCSTWNKMILLKGPGWNEEWNKFQKSSFKDELLVENQLEYRVGTDAKMRKLILLSRQGRSKNVPRGTKHKITATSSQRF